MDYVDDDSDLPQRSERNTPLQDQNLLKQVLAAQRRQEDVSKLTQPQLIVLPSLRPRRALGERIQERCDRYYAKIQSPAFSKAAAWKVARAVEEHRVEEAKIESVFSRLDVVSNRGAYAMACFKSAFKSVNLSWFEEQWEDA